jgi:large subunit ribosomal protein L25
MSERFALEAATRTVVGKKVKTLRAQGQVPAVVYGPDRDPLHITIDWKTLRPILIQAGGTNLVDIQVDGQTVTTLIRDVQRDPIKFNEVQHVDFYAVNLKETIIAQIPVTMTNERETIDRINGRIVLDYPMIEIEALPGNLPSEIELDVSVLQEIGDAIYVDGMPEIEGVAYRVEPDVAIVRSDYLQQRPELEAEEEEEEVIDEGVEPEVIARGKEEEEFEE